MEHIPRIFDDLVNNYKDMVYNLLFRLTGDFHLSEDLFQETYMRVYKGLSSYAGKSKPSTWVYSIALNVFKEYARKKRWRLLNAGELKKNNSNTVDNKSPEDLLIIDEEKRSIQKKLNVLKSSLKIPVVLYYIEGLSIKEIKEITRRSEPDIKVSLYRARKILRKEWGTDQ